MKIVRDEGFFRDIVVRNLNVTNAKIERLNVNCITCIDEACFVTSTNKSIKGDRTYEKIILVKVLDTFSDKIYNNKLLNSCNKLLNINGCVVEVNKCGELEKNIDDGEYEIEEVKVKTLTYDTFIKPDRIKILNIKNNISIVPENKYLLIENETLQTLNVFLNPAKKIIDVTIVCKLGRIKVLDKLLLTGESIHLLFSESWFVIL
jgi:hypothetical protein